MNKSTPNNYFGLKIAMSKIISNGHRNIIIPKRILLEIN